MNSGDDHNPIHDPLQAAKREAPSFNTAWLKNGESMPLVQRIGFTIFSFAFIVAGLFLIQMIWTGFRDQDLGACLFGLPGIVFLVVGFLGLRNVMRFNRSKSSD